VREEIPLLVYRAVAHVLEAMRAGQAVTVAPLRPELPIDEAADAIGIGRDDLRKHVAAGEIPFRSSEYVDWVQLADVIRWDNERRARRRAILDEMLADDPADDEG
jgi:cytochrome P450